MSDLDTRSVAFVRDWLTVYGGADPAMEAALSLFPQAPIYTLLCQAENFRDTPIAEHPIHTSFIDRLPGGHRWHQAYLPLMPLAIEQLDLRGYDAVISLSHAVAKGVLTRADQLHVSYLFTPARYAWDLYLDALDERGLSRGLRSGVTRLVMHYLRMWDVASSQRADVVVADSRHVARRIWKTYRRRAEVIYPPVDIDRFHPASRRDDFFLTVSRLVPYKKVALLVETFTNLRLPLVVVGDGPERRRVERLAGPSVHLLGRQSDATVRDLLERCRAFVFAAEEDFGIAPIEAQAAGAPVIAYDRGASAEWVVPGESGVLFSHQTVESLTEAIHRFDRQASDFDPDLVRLTTQRFSRQRFQREFAALVEREWLRFTGHAHDAHELDAPWSLAV